MEPNTQEEDVVELGEDSANIEPKDKGSTLHSLKKKRNRFVQQAESSISNSNFERLVTAFETSLGTSRIEKSRNEIKEAISHLKELLGLDIEGSMVIFEVRKTVNERWRQRLRALKGPSLQLRFMQAE